MAKRGGIIGAVQRPMTEKRKADLLVALRQHGGVYAAALRAVAGRTTTSGVGPCYSSFKSAMRRDPAFAAQVAEVLQDCRDDLESEIFRRGQIGYLDPVYQKGQRVMDTDDDGNPVKASVRRYSDNLLLARARALMPERYSEKLQVNHGGSIGHFAESQVSITTADLTALNPEMRKALTEILFTIQAARSDGDVPAIEHRPGEILDAEFTEAEDDPTDAELERAIPY